MFIFFRCDRPHLCVYAFIYHIHIFFLEKRYFFNVDLYISYALNKGLTSATLGGCLPRAPSGPPSPRTCIGACMPALLLVVPCSPCCCLPAPCCPPMSARPAVHTFYYPTRDQMDIGGLSSVCSKKMQQLCLLRCALDRGDTCSDELLAAWFLQIQQILSKT